MSLRPVSMVVPAARDHCRQLACAIRDGKRLIHARPAHGREGFDFDFGKLDFVIDLRGVAEWRQLEDSRDRGYPMRLGAIGRVETDEELLSHRNALPSGIAGTLFLWF